VLGICANEDTAAEWSASFDLIVQLSQFHIIIQLHGVSPPENSTKFSELACRQVIAEVCPSNLVTSSKDYVEYILINPFLQPTARCL
jgi:hypothetical protein